MTKLAILLGSAVFVAGCADSDVDRTAATDSTGTDTYAFADTTEDSSRALNRTDTNSQSASLRTDTNAIADASAIGGPGSSQQGSATEKNLKKAQPSELAQFIDYKVIDQQGQQAGTVEALWENESGQPAYLAITESGNENQIHVVPASGVEVNQQRQMIRVPYAASVIKSSPSFSKEAELDQQAQQRIASYFSSQTQAQGSSGQAQTGQTDDRAVINLKKEQLEVGKRTVDAGGVRLKKVIRTEKVNKPVTLQHEELVIERVPGGGEAAENANFQEGEIFIPLQRQEAVVNKDAVVKEKVVLDKDVEQQQRQITGEVREEELKIQKQGVGSPGQTEEGSKSQTEQEVQQEQQQQPQE